MILLLLQLSLPNATTPGVVRPLTVEQICSTKWGIDHRNVTEVMKRQVAANYGLKRADIKPRGTSICCEVDHKVPRELGGADDVANLWPQFWDAAKKKDAEENAYHKQVCAGITTLIDAQQHFIHWGEK